MSKRNLINHPSFGMISISHVGCSQAKRLFGSGIKHSNFVEIEIYTADQEEDSYNTYYFQRKKLISVYLSAAQFTGLLTRTNTIGVPCTIHYTKDDGIIEHPPDKHVREKMLSDIKKEYYELASVVKSLKEEINDDLKGQVSAAKKQKIKDNVGKIYQDVASNLKFLMEQQIKTLENVGIEIQAEAESSINSMIKSLGIEALQEQSKLQLEQLTEKKED
jgi:hypothetical protein